MLHKITLRNAAKRINKHRAVSCERLVLVRLGKMRRSIVRQQLFHSCAFAVFTHICIFKKKLANHYFLCHFSATEQ